MRALEVSSLDEVFDCSGLLHGLHQGNAGDAIVADAQDAGHGFGRCREDLLHGGIAQQGGHPTVVGRGRAAALHMAEDRDARILTGLLSDGVGDVLSREKVAVAVGSTLSDEDDRLAAPRLASEAQMFGLLVFDI